MWNSSRTHKEVCLTLDQFTCLAACNSLEVSKLSYAALFTPRTASVAVLGRQFNSRCKIFIDNVWDNMHKYVYSQKLFLHMCITYYFGFPFFGSFDESQSESMP